VSASTHLPPETIKTELRKFISQSPELAAGLRAGVDLCAWVPALDRYAFVCTHRRADLFVLLLTETEAAQMALETMPSRGVH
jgi:hypothetical protein